MLKEKHDLLKNIEDGKPISKNLLSDWVRSFFSLGYANADPEDEFCNGYGHCIEMQLKEIKESENEK